MKDSEFIELLNLYLDHEITAADAARLETEVQANPERRNVYLQYCRMQKACTVLAKDLAEKSATAEAEGRKIVAFEPQRSAWSAGLRVAGGIAAAACVALVLLNRPAASVDAEPAVAATQLAAAPAEAKVLVAQTGLSLAPMPATTIARTVSMPVGHRVELQPVLTTRGLTLANQTAADELAAASDAAAKFDWIAGLQIAPVQRVHVEDLRFESRSIAPAKTPTFGSPRRPEQGVVELTAFQISK